jgi:hypothetical protein
VDFPFGFRIVLKKHGGGGMKGFSFFLFSVL